MKLSEQTIEILKNFATINQNIVINKGNVLKTISESRTIIGQAEIDVEIPTTFGIYDLSEFLGTLSLVDNPELKFSQKHVTISDGSGLSKIKYYYSDPEMLTYPSKDIAMPPIDVSFALTEATLNKIKRAASTLNHDEVTISNDGDNLVLSVTDTDNKTSNVFSIVIPGSFDKEADFNLILNINNLKLISGDYEVEISKKLISSFQHTTQNIKYWVALEKNSNYN